MVSRHFDLSSLRGEHLSPAGRLRRLASLERGDIAIVVIYAVAIGLVSLAVPLAAQALINTYAFTALPQPIIVLSVLVCLGLATAAVLRLLQHVVVERLQQRLFVRATTEVVDRFTRVDAKAFTDIMPSQAASRFFDIVIVQKTITNLLLDGLSTILQSIVSLVLLAFYHPALLAFDLVLIALILVIVFGLGKDGVKSSVKESKAKYAVADWLGEVAHAFRSFRSNDAAANLARSHADDLAAEYVVARKNHFRVLALQIGLAFGLQALATATLLGLGGFLVVSNQLTPGQLVAAEIIVTTVLASVAKFGKYLEDYYDLCAAADKLGGIVDLPLAQRGTTGAASPELASPLAIDLGTESIEVEPGRPRAVLVRDARSKRDLIDLVENLTPPRDARISLAGLDARAYASDAWKDCVLVVRRAELTGDTILDNLRLGRDDVSSATLHAALRITRLDRDLQRMPDGITTKIGFAGAGLTSNQQARLMLARALVARPRVLVCDETLDVLSVDEVRDIAAAIVEHDPEMSLLVVTGRRDLAMSLGSVTMLGDAS